MRPDWFIHLEANGLPCSCCGKIEYPYIDNICDAHTDGLSRRYGHPEFQMIVQYAPEYICYVLNTLGEQVRAGKKFSAGYVSGIFLDCDIRLDPIQSGRHSVLRVIIPDAKNRWPEDPACDYPYNMQIQPIEALRRSPHLN